MKLLFCGDIMPGGVLPYQTEYVSIELLEYIKSFDFRIGTLESAIGTDLPYDEVKMKGRQNIVYARNEDFFRVKDMGFDVVSLANNHIWDLGRDGLANTIHILKENNIQYCGAGMDIEEASRPAIIEKDGLKIAILAYCMYGNPWLGYVELAGEKKAGVNPLDIDKVLSDINKYKKLFDKVIVMPHWGKEYTNDPLPECVKMAKIMIESGADAVLGSHTHRIQPLVSYQGVPICYSMGNFMFPDFYMYPPRPIWYPPLDTNLSSIEKVVGYPFPITNPIKQVWNSMSRYGRIVELNVTNKTLTASSQFVHCSVDNIVDLDKLPRSEKKRLFISSELLKSALFRLVVRCKRRFF